MLVYEIRHHLPTFNGSCNRIRITLQSQPVLHNRSFLKKGSNYSHQVHLKSGRSMTVVKLTWVKTSFLTRGEQIHSLDEQRQLVAGPFFGSAGLFVARRLVGLSGDRVHAFAFEFRIHGGNGGLEFGVGIWKKEIIQKSELRLGSLIFWPEEDFNFSLSDLSCNVSKASHSVSRFCMCSTCTSWSPPQK